MDSGPPLSLRVMRRHLILPLVRLGVIKEKLQTTILICKLPTTSYASIIRSGHKGLSQPERAPLS